MFTAKLTFKVGGLRLKPLSVCFGVKAKVNVFFVHLLKLPEKVLELSAMSALGFVLD